MEELTKLEKERGNPARIIGLAIVATFMSLSAFISANVTDNI